VVDAKNFFKELRKAPDTFLVIHYSSQGLYDEGIDGLSPRITSIVVRHYSTRQTLSFTIHAVAEDLGIPKEEVEHRYDEVEREVLKQFYAFSRNNVGKTWVHWQMKNLVFGFEHLEHRYRMLSREEPHRIPIEARVNIVDILRERYGEDFAPDPRMKNLMLLNGPIDRRFLSGEDEAAAFKNQEFIRMNTSTISKVEFFWWVIEQARRGKLHTAGNRLINRVDRLLESRWSRLGALIGTAIALATAAYKFVGLLL
jgi:hypothetical protein